jgi:hypothetical protein
VITSRTSNCGWPNDRATAAADCRWTHNASGCDTKGKRRPHQNDLTVAVHADRDHLSGAPVREPQTVLVPAGLLWEHEPGHQGLNLRRTVPPVGSSWTHRSSLL